MKKIFKDSLVAILSFDYSQVSVLCGRMKRRLIPCVRQSLVFLLNSNNLRQYSAELRWTGQRIIIPRVCRAVHKWPSSKSKIASSLVKHGAGRLRECSLGRLLYPGSQSTQFISNLPWNLCVGKSRVMLVKKVGQGKKQRDLWKRRGSWGEGGRGKSSARKEVKSTSKAWSNSHRFIFNIPAIAFQFDIVGCEQPGAVPVVSYLKIRQEGHRHYWFWWMALIFQPSHW